MHFGTGEEILHQTDFVLDGPIPIEWTRCYRFGSESEDWGLLGARWATPFTSSLSICPSGIVYHEGSGRALRLPPIATGQEHDHRAEGLTLRHDSDTQFTLIWRDGSTDTFLRGPDGVLPHGYDGVNAMLAPRTPLRAERYHLARSVGRDGRGIRIERRHDAQPGEVLLRLSTDDGLIVEAVRDDLLMAPHQQAEHVEPPRIGRIEEVRADGSRICHVSYRYASESSPGNTSDVPSEDAFAALPQRYNLVEQSNLIGEKRTYTYRHHLLVGYTTYSGFAHGLEWVSLSFLRERWAGSPLDDAQLAERHPITLANSYQARAVRTLTADGNDEVAIAYIDADTTRVTEADGGVLEYRFNANWLVTEVRRISPDGGPPRSLGRREWDADGVTFRLNGATPFRLNGATLTGRFRGSNGVQECGIFGVLATAFSSDFRGVFCRLTGQAKRVRRRLICRQRHSAGVWASGAQVWATRFLLPTRSRSDVHRLSIQRRRTVAGAAVLLHYDRAVLRVGVGTASSGFGLR